MLQVLEIVKLKEKLQTQNIQECEKVKQEVVAEFQTAANINFVEQIVQKKVQMYYLEEKEVP